MTKIGTAPKMLRSEEISNWFIGPHGYPLSTRDGEWDSLLLLLQQKCRLFVPETQEIDNALKVTAERRRTELL